MEAAAGSEASEVWEVMDQVDRQVDLQLTQKVEVQAAEAMDMETEVEMDIPELAPEPVHMPKSSQSSFTSFL